MHSTRRSLIMSTLAAMLPAACSRSSLGLRSGGPDGGGVSLGGMTGSGGTGVAISTSTQGGIIGSGGAVGSSSAGGSVSNSDAPVQPSGGAIAVGAISGSYGGTTGPGSTPSDAASQVGDPSVPLQHRSTSLPCPSQRGPAPQDCTAGACTGQPYPGGIVSLNCSSDSECAAGVNGRCFPPKVPGWAGGCSYDECFNDSSCGLRTPCVCRTSSTDNSANICDVGGNCAVDADCGPGGYCSPSMESCTSTNPDITPEASNGPNPYYCHTASDICINDSDCSPPDTTIPPAITVCAYSAQNARWECTNINCGRF